MKAQIENLLKGVNQESVDVQQLALKNLKYLLHNHQVSKTVCVLIALNFTSGHLSLAYRYYYCACLLKFQLEIQNLVLGNETSDPIISQIILTVGGILEKNYQNITPHFVSAT